MSHLLKTTFWCLLLSVMVGCGSADKRADYKRSTTAKSLEIPPDLIGSSKMDEQMVVPDAVADETTTFSEYNREHSENEPVQPSGGEYVLPISKKVQIKRDGNIRWLVLQGDRNTVWSKVKQFWLEEGLPLETENPSIGIMETQWLENRADIPHQGLRKLLGNVFDMMHSATTRDQFRVRLEPGSVANTTELYLTHRGIEQVVKGDDFVWQRRPSDSELEAEILNRLIVFFGPKKERADTIIAETEKESVSRAKLTTLKDGQVNLVVNEDFAQTWRRTSLALDRLGFTVQDRDRSSGVYFIRYIDPDVDSEKGFFSSLFGGETTLDNQEYRISLRDDSPITRIIVLNSNGQPVANKTAERILTLLQEQLQ